MSWWFNFNQMMQAIGNLVGLVALAILALFWMGVFVGYQIEEFKKKRKNDKKNNQMA